MIMCRKVHTKAAKEWLKKFEVTEGGGEEELELMKNNLRSVISGQHFESKKPDGEKVPVLVCLTFADRLLVRDFMNQDSGQYNIGEAEKGIAKHFEVSSIYKCVTSRSEECGNKKF